VVKVTATQKDLGNSERNPSTLWSGVGRCGEVYLPRIHNIYVSKEEKRKTLRPGKGKRVEHL